MTPRTFAFISVGIAGFVAQTIVLAALTLRAHWPVTIATAVGVETAIVTNFYWHERWTWRDRAEAGTRWSRLLRFHMTNGATSLTGNTVLIVFLVRVFGLNPIAANVVAVGLLSVINFLAADRWVFSGRAAAIGATLVIVQPLPAAAAEPTRVAVAAWNRYVAATEAALPQHERDVPLAEPQGRTIDADGATIHEWRGSILVRGVTVHQVVDALINAGVKQEDVADSRLLERNGDSMRIYLKLVRRAIVTVTYDSEHDVQYIRRSPTFATSRSVATRLTETGGDDRGFLWRLNSYWRYRQIGDDVQVDVLSLSLSRDIPWLFRPIAAPIINRIGRESMNRTLQTVELRAHNREAHVTSRQSTSDFTTIPEASRLSRTLRARTSAPSVSLWTQMVSTFSVTLDPSTATTE
jgi:putative flippase GtrA